MELELSELSLLNFPWSERMWEKVTGKLKDFEKRQGDIPEGRGKKEYIDIPDGQTTHKVQVCRSSGIWQITSTDGWFIETLASPQELKWVIEEKITIDATVDKKVCRFRRMFLFSSLLISYPGPS